MKPFRWLLFLLMACLAQAQPVPDTGKGLRVFSAGHSFHSFVPEMLAEVAASAGYTNHVIVGQSMIGGSQVSRHWLIPDPNPIKEALMASSVDVLTLTPIYLPDDGIAKFAQFGSEHYPNLRVTVQEFWLPYDAYEPGYFNEPQLPRPVRVDHNAATAEGLRSTHAPYFAEMDAMVSTLNANLKRPVVSVVPVGQAVIALREKIIAGEAPGLRTQEDLFTDALGHPKPALQLLTVYCHYAVIYRRSPEGLPVPAVLKAWPAEEAVELNALLQKTAWEAVTAHPLSGVR